MLENENFTAFVLLLLGEVGYFFFSLSYPYAARFLLHATKQLLYDNPGGAAPRAVGAMKRAAAAPVLRSDALRELILVGLAQINTARPCSRSCGPLPGWPPLFCCSSTHRTSERKQASEREKERASEAEPKPAKVRRAKRCLLSEPGLSHACRTPRVQPAASVTCQKALRKLIYSHPPNVAVCHFFFFFSLPPAERLKRFYSASLCAKTQLSNPKRPSGMPNAFFFCPPPTLSLSLSEWMGVWIWSLTAE